MADTDIIHLTQANFDAVTQGDQPVLVDFWADWCAPCKRLAPIFEEVSRDFAGRVRFAKVNVDEEGELASRFGVMSIPTLLLFKGGQVIDRLVGLQPRSALQKAVEQALSG